MRPDEPRDEFEIDLTPIWPEEDGRLEPIFLPGPLWIDFEDFEPFELLPGRMTAGIADEPFVVAFDQFAQLAWEPAAGVPAGGPAGGPDGLLDRAQQMPPQRASAVGVLGSLGVHLLTLLVLIGWSAAPTEVSGAIPVRLVLEEASGAANEALPGEAMAESVGEPAKADATAPAPPPAVPAAPTSPPAAPTPPPKLATATQPAKPTPPLPKPVAAPPPAPARTASPAPPPAPVPTRVAAAPPRPAPAATSASAASAASTVAPRPTGAAPATGSGDYLNQLVALTRGHLNILPLSFLAGRRGRTTLSVLVIEDGTIGRISVKRSSGYPDIDARIEQMVAAVGRFPPVPASLTHPSVELDFDMSFPDAMPQ